jgi:hypothetical protein
MVPMDRLVSTLEDHTSSRGCGGFVRYRMLQIGKPKEGSALPVERATEWI